MNNLLNWQSPVFDDRFGILKCFGFTDTRRIGDLFNYSVMAYTLNNKMNFRKIRSSGAGLSREEAILSAIYEGLERYTLLTGRAPKELIKNKSDLGESDPIFADFEFFNDEQKEQQMLDDKKATNLIKNLENSSVFIAAKLLSTRSSETAYIPLGVAVSDVDFNVFDCSTNGMGAGANKDYAEKSALYELIERDAFQHAWLTQGSLFDFKFESTLSPESKVFSVLERMGLLRPFIKIRLAKTILGDFSVITSLENHSLSWIPAFSISSAYRPVIEDAIYKSLLELSQMLYISPQEPHKSFSNLQNFDCITTFEDHYKYYHNVENLPQLGIFNHSSCLPNVDSVQLAIDSSHSSVLQKIEKSHIKIFFVNLTPAELKDFPAYICRAVSPDLLPLNFNHRHRPLGHRRLKNIAPAKIWPFPHPFP